MKFDDIVGAISEIMPKDDWASYKGPGEAPYSGNGLPMWALKDCVYCGSKAGYVHKDGCGKGG
jgi:hypothetical protein